MDESGGGVVRYGSVCSGIEAASVAWEPLGMKPAWFSEIEAFPSAVLAHHWPDVKNLGDMTKISRRVLLGEIEAPDVLVGGTPCFTAGQAVLTDRGYVPIENIFAGDMVVSHRGRLCKVVRVGSKEADVGFMSGVGIGVGITCTAEHPFRSVEWISQNTRRNGKYARVERMGDPSWTAAKEMPGQQWCALKKLSVEAPAFPEGINSSELLYIAGFYLGDGHIRRWAGRNKKAVIFGVNDAKAQAFERRVSLHVTVMSERTGPRIQLANTAIAEWLVANFGEYSNSKTLPAWVLSHADRAALLDGYLDTDGHMQSSGWRSVSVSRALAFGIRDLAQTLNMVASVSFTKTADKTIIEGREVNQRDYWTVTAFDGKKSRKSRTGHGMLLRRVSAFDPAGIDTVFNIEVDGDHSYILDGAIVHNCQAFSVAGMREGMADERGQLTMKYVELANAIDTVRVRAGNPETVIVWENVPGVLSDKSNAFGCFLGALAGEDRELQPSGKKWTNAGCVYGPQRAVAWRVLDAQYFGVAQRRRRVFVVASARADIDPAAVLFERESLRRDTPPSRKKGQGFAADVAPSLTSSRLQRVGDTRGQDSVVAVPIQNATRGKSQNGLGIANPGEPMYTLDQGSQHAVTVALRGREGGATAEMGGDVATALRASTGGGDKSHVLATRQVAQTITQNYGKQPDNSDTALGPNLALHDLAVRRLTPIECERLQGFPEHEKTFSAIVFTRGLSGCSENQASLAPAVAQNHRSQKPVLNAEGGESQSPVRHVEKSSITCQAEKSELAAVNVLIDLERRHLLVSSAEKLIWSASIAGSESESLLPIQSEDFARLAALMTQTAAPTTHSGKAASQESETSSSNLLNGKQHSELCGQEIEGLASDAERFTKMVRSYLKSTTLQAGRISQKQEQPLITLFCCVAAAINGFIPERTRSADLYSLKVTISYGHTAVPYRNKPAADGPRYKAIGNSMAVPCMSWIGSRLTAFMGVRHAAN